MRRILTIALGLGLFALLGCPETSKEIGHAPKKQIDKAQRAADKAEKDIAAKAAEANKAAESAAGVGE